MNLSAKLRAKKVQELITAEKFMTDEQRLAYREPKSKVDNFFGRMLIISFVFAVLVYSFVLFYKNGYFNGSGGCKKPIINYFEAICERDFDSYIESMPYEWRTDYQVQLNTLGYNKYDYLDTLYSDLFDIFGKDMDIKLTFLSTTNSSSLATDISRDFYEKYRRSLNIEDCCVVKVMAHFEGNRYSIDQYIYCTVIKLKGRWYIIDAGKGSSERTSKKAYLT